MSHLNTVDMTLPVGSLTVHSGNVLVTSGNLGIGTLTPSERVHCTDVIRTDNAFNCSGASGITQSATVLDALGATHVFKFSGGILIQYSLSE